MPENESVFNPPSASARAAHIFLGQSGQGARFDCSLHISLPTISALNLGTKAWHTETMNIKLENVSPEDAAGLSQVMMRAFYRDPHWRLLWGSMTLEDIILSCENRLPRNLVKGRGSRRHRKAVDAVTGEVVGYARWVLPEGQEDLWKDAQVAEPSAQQAAQYEARYSAYMVDGKIKGLNNEITESLSPLLEKTEEDILKTGKFLSKSAILCVLGKLPRDSRSQVHPSARLHCGASRSATARDRVDLGRRRAQGCREGGSAGVCDVDADWVETLSGSRVYQCEDR